jgi:hypothetical protein
MMPMTDGFERTMACNARLVHLAPQVIARTKAQLASSPTPDAKGRTLPQGTIEAGVQAHARSPRSVVQDVRFGRRPFTVMAGLVPAIHVFLSREIAKTWTNDGAFVRKATIFGPTHGMNASTEEWVGPRAVQFAMSRPHRPEVWRNMTTSSPIRRKQ